MALGRQVSVLLAALVCALALAMFSSRAQGESPEFLIDEDPEGNPYVAGSLLVTFETDEFGKVLKDAGFDRARVADDIPELNVRVVEFPGVKDERTREQRERLLEETRKDLAGNSAVESVDYDYVRQLSYIPNDPRFGSQWGLKKANFPKAWDKKRGSGVKIAVIDTGIAIKHVELRRKIAAQRDFVGKDRWANDKVGHGTHVSGILAARTGNKWGIAGGCPRCNLVVAKALGRYGGTDSRVARAIVWAAKKKPKVMNMSLGGPGYSGTLKKAVNFAQNRGVVVVAAAGNEGTNKPSYPAAYSGVMAVAATNGADRRPKWSNRGKWVDIAAPGTNILSTVPGGYKKYSGTSMASPHVAALAALLADKGYGPKKIKERIFRSAKDIGPKGRDPYYGAGRIDAGRALGS
jgi:thermitase